jgi:pimeloyl-ACP methyl ester carboxylesterase
MSSGEFVEVNGTRLYYEASGRSDAPAVVLVHGFSLDTRMWAGQVGPLSDRYRVVCYDLRGFGRSAIPEAGVLYQHHEDLRALLDRLEIERAAVVGLSLGGAVALDFALHHRQRLTSLVLADAVVPGFDAPDLADLSRQVWNAGRTNGVEAAKAIWLASPFFEQANQRSNPRSALLEMVADYSGWGWTERDPGRWGESNMAARLAEIVAPTLIIVGEHDIEGMRNAADALAREIPNARKVVLPGLGHLPNMEDPAAFNSVILEFLDGVATLQ